MLLRAAAAYAKLGQGLDLDALEASATAVGSSRRREEVSKKREAEEEAAGEGAAKVRGAIWCSWAGCCGYLLLHVARHPAATSCQLPTQHEPLLDTMVCWILLRTVMKDKEQVLFIHRLCQYPCLVHPETSCEASEHVARHACHLTIH